MQQQVVAVDPVGRTDRRHDGRGVVVRREELEAHRLDARTGGATEPHVPLECRLQPVVEQQPERDVQAADQRDGRRECRVQLVLGLLVRDPVEVEAARRLRPLQHVRRHGDHREPGRGHQRLLRAGDDDVDPPRVRLERDRTERRDRVDHERRVADRLLDGAHVGDDAGGRVGLLAQHEVDTGLRHRRPDLAGIGNLSPFVADRLHVDAVLLADRDPALPERAVADDGDPVARFAEVRDRRLHRPRARGAEQQHVGLGAVHVFEPRQRARVDLAEVGPAVVDDRLRSRREHLGRHGRRPRREQVALLQVRQATDEARHYPG